MLNILLAALVLVLALAIVPAFLGSVKEEYKHTFYGLRPYLVKTESMEPTIRKGALVLGRAVKFEELRQGDIITFAITREGGEALNTHRIVEKKAAYLTTKGDNADRADELPVTQSNYKYRVVKIWNGVARMGSLKGVVLYVLLPLMGLAVLITGAMALLIWLRRREKPEQQEKPAEEPTPAREEPDEEDYLLSVVDAVLCPPAAHEGPPDGTAQPPEEDDDEVDEELLEWLDYYLVQGT